MSERLEDIGGQTEDLEANTEEKGATTKTLMATLEHIQSLHAECDWLLPGARNLLRQGAVTLAWRRQRLGHWACSDPG